MSLVLDGTAGITFNNATTQASAGQVLQVVNSSTTTEVSNSTSTYADTNLTATITPKFSTSKILVLISQNGCGKNSNNTKLQLRLARDGSSIATITGVGGITDTTATNFFGGLSISYLDSPATTSATTYKTQFASGNNNTSVFVNSSSSGVFSTSTITLMEIAA
jgi:hypothetical protein